MWQGRYRDVVVENGDWAYELSTYLHLNPLRTMTLAGMDPPVLTRMDPGVGAGRDWAGGAQGNGPGEMGIDSADSGSVAGERVLVLPLDTHSRVG